MRLFLSAGTNSIFLSVPSTEALTWTKQKVLAFKHQVPERSQRAYSKTVRSTGPKQVTQLILGRSSARRRGRKG